MHNAECRCSLGRKHRCVKALIKALMKYYRTVVRLTVFESQRRVIYLESLRHLSYTYKSACCVKSNAGKSCSFNR